MKQLLFTSILNILLLICNIPISAQSWRCYTIAPEKDYLKDVLGITYSDYIFYRQRQTCQTEIVNIFIHVIRRSNHTGGLSVSQVNNWINVMVNDYTDGAIGFGETGRDFIDNDYYYYNWSNAKFNSLISTNSHNNAIDIYLLPAYISYARASDIPGKALVIGGAYGGTSVLPHEMGHCLGLYHTHSGRGCGDYANCAEAIDGSNCETCGDLICDTPADPCLMDNVNQNCEYTGGGGFDPDVENILSYTLPECMEHLTEGQFARIHTMIEYSQTLQDVLYIASISGPDMVCYSPNQVFTLNNRPYGTAINWTYSTSLLYPVSGQGTNDFTVRALTPYVGWEGWVQANIDIGDCDPVSFRYEDFWVGVPYVNPATIEFTCVEGPGYFCTNAFGNEYSFSFSYDYNYFDVKLTNLSETQTLYQDRIYSTWSTLEYWPPEGTYKFMVRGSNDCGTATNWSKTTVDYVDCGWRGFLNIVPNPATDEITMELKTDKIDTFSEGDIWEAEIFNQQMLLMHKTTRLKDKTYTINVSGWKEGVYYVRAKVKDKLLSGKFIISR